MGNIIFLQSIYCDKSFYFTQCNIQCRDVSQHWPFHITEMPVVLNTLILFVMIQNLIGLDVKMCSQNDIFQLEVSSSSAKHHSNTGSELQQHASTRASTISIEKVF